MNPMIASQFQYEISRATEVGTDTGAVSQALGDKFLALLAQATPHVAETNAAGSNNLVEKAVEDQANDYQQVPNDLLYMTQHMSALSMQRIAAVDMTVQLEVASLSADLQVKMAAVQSSKDAVQTLVKNQ
ncbi:MAG: type secretion inner rod protein HrpB2 [Paraburkholderia sp.]|jgi:type III secretion inner rod protein HrpB2|nr:type secretion inner rod protein HrpB2 [Paraburkholderia sp.]MEA3121207.1 type secretion inner rod protein HrpB2 [Paraburkholderia sp.]